MTRVGRSPCRVDGRRPCPGETSLREWSRGGTCLYATPTPGRRCLRLRRDALAGRIHGQGTHRCSVARHDGSHRPSRRWSHARTSPSADPVKRRVSSGDTTAQMTGPAWPLRRRAQPSPSPTSPVRASLASITRRASARPAAQPWPNREGPSRSPRLVRRRAFQLLRLQFSGVARPPWPPRAQPRARGAP